jgi:hypothetical protein
MKSVLDKLGSFGALAAAAACPVCFPKLAVIGALIGLGGAGVYEAQLFIAAQVLVVVAIAGHALSYRQHGRRWLLALAIVGGAAVFLGLYLVSSEWLAYAGLSALVAASMADIWARLGKRAPADCALDSVITCPQCGHRRREIMPTGACLFFYDCTACGAALKPKHGDCCVFCSFGSVKCPSRQPAACCPAEVT